ncbi:MAG: ATP-grasp domain-containing protein [Gammaproteobacteria bacterium]|nr:ATP-grasp domain-containing protein [Gammaproteobacteria bacterium]
MSDEVKQFARLQSCLPKIWQQLQTDSDFEHTSLIVPSLSVDQEVLSKVLGSSFYEERLLFALIRLRNPRAKVIYVTSMPVNPDIVDYYLQLLDGVTLGHARQRLLMVSVYDFSSRPLSEKILERPRFMDRLRGVLGDPERAYLTCYNSTKLERQLAVELGIPLNGVDPDLLYYGTKSGSRAVFMQAGVNMPAGSIDLRSEDDIVTALVDLGKQRPETARAVVKINEGFAGEGNAMFTFPANRTDAAAVRQALHELEWSSPQQTYSDFMRKFADMGGIVEEMVVGSNMRSPSVQMRIHPDGTAAIVSSHEQVLGGATGQVYLGCRFPAMDDYRQKLHSEAMKIGQVLADKGVLGRFGVDFLASRNAEGDWQLNVIEINLRMCGTTPPYHALEFLTGGGLDPDSGLFYTPQGQVKYYSATDNLKSPAYRGLLPEDLFQVASRHGINFRHATQTGVLFYIIGALSQYGKLGMTCIGNTPEEAEELYEKTVDILDDLTEGADHGVAASIIEHFLNME